MKFEYEKSPNRQVRALQLAEQIEQDTGYGTKIQVTPKKIKIWIPNDLSEQEVNQLNNIVENYEYAPLPIGADVDFLLQSSDGSVWRFTVTDQGLLKSDKVT